MKKLLIASVSVLALSAGAAFANDSSSEIVQEGSNSVAHVEQIGGAGKNNSSYVFQDGGNPTISYLATLNGRAVVGGVSVYQDGSTANNTSNVWQHSNYDGASVVQYGRGNNSSNIWQSGNSNAAQVTQSGGAANNISNITQNMVTSGLGSNVASVRQH